MSVTLPAVALAGKCCEVGGLLFIIKRVCNIFLLYSNVYTSKQQLTRVAESSKLQALVKLILVEDDNASLQVSFHRCAQTTNTIALLR